MAFLTAQSHISIKALLAKGSPHKQKRARVQEKGIHGTLMEIFHMGILFLGDAGSGKTTLAKELLERGHSFICDDLVLIHKDKNGRLKGRGALSGQYPLYLREEGFMDVKDRFGEFSVKQEACINIVLHLDKGANRQSLDPEIFSANTDFFRLGNKSRLDKILFIEKIASTCQKKS